MFILVSSGFTFTLSHCYLITNNSKFRKSYLSLTIFLRVYFTILQTYSSFTSFQSFLEANSKCWWNAALVDATRQLRYKGHVSPGVLMVGGPPCALEVLRAAWARNVLRPPADHAITCLGKYSSSPPFSIYTTYHHHSETKFLALWNKRSIITIEYQARVSRIME